MRKVEGAQITIIDCEVFQNLLSQVKVSVIFIKVIFEDGVIEDVSAALVYQHISLKSIFKTLWFWHRSQNITPLALWMATTILVVTKRLRFHITNR